MSGKCVVDTCKQFGEYAKRSVKGITFLYLPTEEVLRVPENIKSSPRITNTFPFHMVKRFFDNRKVCFLEFNHLAIDNKPFFYTILCPTRMWPSKQCAW